MRTWKQGIIGRLQLPDSSIVYIKCLKYPLSSFHDRYDIKVRAFGAQLFRAFIEQDTLRCIERIGFARLSAEERKLGELFTVHHRAGSVAIEAITIHGQGDETLAANQGKPCTKEQLQKLYDQESAKRSTGPWVP